MPTLNLQGIRPRGGHIDSSFGDPRWRSVEGWDGRRFAVWFLGDDPHGPAVLFFDTPPHDDGRVGAPHYHDCDQLRFVVDGSFQVGRTWYGPGQFRVQEAGAVYGPERDGPNGSKQLLVVADRQAMPVHPRERDRVQAEPMVEAMRRLMAPGFAMR